MKLGFRSTKRGASYLALTAMDISFGPVETSARYKTKEFLPNMLFVKVGAAAVVNVLESLWIIYNQTIVL